MDVRPKMLIVEDTDQFRGLLIKILEHESYSPVGVSNLKDALRILDECSFDVAIVDIMLNGPSDSSNRDGLLVFRHINKLGEGTKVFALTGQREGPDLARDILKDFGAADYISKKRLSKEGSAYLLGLIKEALKDAGGTAKRSDWIYTTTNLLRGVSEMEFVQDIGHNVQSSGFDVLKTSVIQMTKWLHPVLHPIDAPATRSGTTLPGVFDALYWSKRQGCAVQLIIHGKGTARDAIDAAFKIKESNVLHQGGKGGLKTLAVARPDIARSAFAAK